MNRWLFVIAVTGIAVVTSAHVLNRSVTPVDKLSLFSTLNQTIRSISPSPVEVECPGSVVKEIYESCFGWNEAPETFIREFERRITDMAVRTFGWRQDYRSWMARYELRDNQQMDFAINVVSKDFELGKVPSMRPYKWIVVILVDQ